MKPLFQLVKSLDKGEKRYVKIYSSRHIIMGNSNDMELFDAIVKLKEPSDKALRETIKNPKVVQNLSLYKHILYKNLLKCLNTYHTGKNVEDEILDLYKSVRVLYDKCLYADAKRLIAKARTLALEHEIFGLYAFLREAETKIHERQFDLKEFKIVILVSADEQADAAEKFLHFQKIRRLSNDIYYQSRIWGVTDPELLKHHEPTKSIKEFNKLKSNLNSVKSKLLAWKVMSLIDCGKRDFKSSTEHELNILHELEKKSDDSPGKTEEVLVALYRVSWNYYIMAEHKKLNAIIQRIRKIPDLNNSIRLIKFQMFINYELLNKINRNIGSDALILEEKIEEAYKLNADALGLQRMLIINYNLGILFFIEGNYEKSGKWLDLVVENFNKNIDTDIIISSRLIQLLIKYELGMNATLKYVTLSTKRYIRKRRPLKIFEELIFNHINKLASAKAEDKKQQLFKDFLSKYDELIKSGSPMGGSFAFDLWAKSKIEGRPLRVIFDRDAKH